MKRLLTLRQAPTDRKWWRNAGRGRLLVCKCQSVRVCVRTLEGFCGHCTSALKVKTAPEETAERLAKEPA